MRLTALQQRKIQIHCRSNRARATSDISIVYQLYISITHMAYSEGLNERLAQLVTEVCQHPHGSLEATEVVKSVNFSDAAVGENLVR